MSIVTDFAQEWVLSNIAPEMSSPDDITLGAFVAQLKSDAMEEGIDEEELESDLGDLSEFVLTAIETLGSMGEAFDDDEE